MSPFWKNVNDELQYQGMNFKTLAYLTGIPYTTLTNGKNRIDSIPTADIAIKISRVLNISLERLLGSDAGFSDKEDSPDDESKKKYLFKKYEQLIYNLEKCPPAVQDSLFRMVQAICEK
ncbi:helix-turn-helix transcriptional regulator [Treponema sp.]|uniref:helix-turn-helix transcriptional regulator n=1 Tax=Treponema sp. TaxID=166 RepID=UPI00298E0BE5|nr:helix-turn-helix transcriptional regulator [Treponema sp.]